MATSIYPTFNLPSISAPEVDDSKKIYKSAPSFDYDAGDFVRDKANRIVMSDGREAFMQWCLKQCVTERNTKLSYSDKIGVEITSAIRSEDDIAAVESIIERTITEALMVNKSTEYVRNFSFKWNGSDKLNVAFYVKGHGWPEEKLGVTY